MLHRPGTYRSRWVRVSQWVPDCRGDRAHRIPVGHLAQPSRHVLSGHRLVRNDGKWEEDDEPADAPFSGPLETIPRQAQAHESPYVNKRGSSKPAGTEPAEACGRQPMARPVTSTTATVIAAVIRSAIERPTSTAARHMGRARKRSMTPVERSVARPTAEPIEEVVRFSKRRPAMSSRQRSTICSGKLERQAGAHEDARS